MKRTLLYCLFCFIIMFGLGCAKVPLQDDYQYLDIPPVLTQDDSTAMIWFIMENFPYNFGTTYFIWDGSKKIGMLKKGTCFAYKATPGEHIFWAKTETKHELFMSIEAGKEYYVNGRVGFGILVGRPYLELLQAANGERILRQGRLRYVTLTEEGAK